MFFNIINHPMKILTAACSIIIFFSYAASHAQNITYSPPEFRLTTPWSYGVNPDNPRPEYPRPSMVRAAWKSLNGRWHFEKTKKDSPEPPYLTKEIIVPFPVESALSGVQVKVTPEDRMWYKRTFFVPESWSGRFVLLHIEACDWETTVYINGKEIGMHRGGYDPFTFDISPYLDERGVQEIVISVWDPTNRYHQPRGKQQLNPKGIWYTPVSGIWGPVWIEPVDVSYIKSFKCTPDIDNSIVTIRADIGNGVPGDSINATVSFMENDQKSITFDAAGPGVIKIDNARLWSPGHPNLYDLELQLVRDGKVLDKITSYFGMRKISVAEDRHGKKRLFLNNQPVFMFGLLDQGWWPDGLYTAPTDEALKFDIETTKEMGYNLIRKHVKVEPDRWYTHCDRLGIIVWQDMPNSDKHARWKGPSGIDGVEGEREFVSEAQYKIEFEAIINSLYNHPSIVKWIPFNEGWGQFKTVEIYDWVATLDTTRLLGGPSGGNYFPVGDTRDYHKYPGPAMPPPDPDRALILGEFGGLGYPVPNHLWQSDKNWGYVNIKSKKDLVKAYVELINKLIPLIDEGLAGAIYTQTTDVEGEVNGIMTYDRKVIKLKSNKVLKAHEALFRHYSQVVQGTK